MSPAAVWLPERNVLMGAGTSLCAAREDVCVICIILRSRLKNGSNMFHIQQHVHTTDLPKASHFILHPPPQPLQLTKKTPCCYKSTLPHHSFFFLLPSSAYFRSVISFIIFFLTSCCAVPHCTLLKGTFSNRPSNCRSGEPEPCPLLQEITVRLRGKSERPPLRKQIQHTWNK